MQHASLNQTHALTTSLTVPTGRIPCVAIPIAAGALYPSLGLMLRPEVGALAMSASSITVVANALLLRREVPAEG